MVGSGVEKFREMYGADSAPAREMVYLGGTAEAVGDGVGARRARIVATTASSIPSTAVGDQRGIPGTSSAPAS